MCDDTTMDDDSSPPPDTAAGEAEPAPATTTIEALTPAGEMLRRGLWRRRTDDEFESALGGLFFEGPDLPTKLWRFGSLIVLSSSIAGFGLIADSAGVVIGAMLVAPLMTPIQALGAALVQGSARRMLSSALVIVGGFVGAVVTGYLTSLIGSGGLVVSALPSEILSRTSPKLIDLGIAIAAGAAGGYVIARPEVSSALPGVGIAVALVPPLATIGICIELGEGDLAEGALLLFATNLAAIVLAGAVMILGAGFRPHLAENTGTTARIGFVGAVLLIVIVAIPLARHTSNVIADEQATRTVNDAIPEWDPLVRVVSLDVDDHARGVSIELVVTSPSDPVSVWELARLLRERLGEPVQVNLRVQLEAVDRAVAT
jgi:uncharacterized hydrophobic protein (TIGR00271 family)